METHLLPNIKRVIWVVLDGVGAGALPDAVSYGDTGSNTISNTAKAFLKQTGRSLQLPVLERLGFGSLTPIEGLLPAHQLPSNGLGLSGGTYSKAREKSQGKDTTSGHWEMVGLPVEKAFTTYPNGFSNEVIDRWVKENNLAGVLGNKAASGTTIIDELGPEHIRTLKPILYTSADSVWQVAAHETYFGLERLIEICKSARKLCDELQISRVIARPFIGDPAKGQPFKRTYHRKDLSQKPPRESYLNALCKYGIPTLGIGKISNIFAGEGIQENIDTEGNTDGLQVLIREVTKQSSGLIFCNLIDFDMLYGHRRDPVGFGHALEEADQALAKVISQMQRTDLLMLTADHGNDPTFSGSDHTREYAPILAYSPAQKTTEARPLLERESFADQGATLVEALLGREVLEKVQAKNNLIGKSFFGELFQ